MTGAKWLGVGTFLLAVCALGAADQEKGGKKDIADAPKGFDSRRDGIERGQVETVEYDSKSVGGKRKLVVYLPPGYSKEGKYPVLYLLHGAGGDESNWTRMLAAHVILDNLYADKKAVPMIVVMPNGSPGGSGFRTGNLVAGPITRAADADKDGKVTLDEFMAAAKRFYEECDKDKKGAIGEKQIAEGINRLMPPPGRGQPGRGFDFITTFQNDLLKDILPFVESHYPVRTDPQGRALAGLSMGGGQALGIGLKHLDQFAWIGGFSSAIFSDRTALVPSAADAGKIRLLWISCGDRDRLMDRSKALHEALEEKNVSHVWHIDTGDHEPKVWRNDLYLLAQILFRDK